MLFQFFLTPYATIEELFEGHNANMELNIADCICRYTIKANTIEEALEKYQKILENADFYITKTHYAGRVFENGYIEIL